MTHQRDGKVHHGDCLDVLKTMEPGVDLIVTSPPYDNQRTYGGFKLDIHRLIPVLRRVMTVGGVVVWVVADQVVDGSETGTSFKTALTFMEGGFRLHDTMIYQKQNYTPLTHNRYEQSFEYMFVFSLGSPRVFNGLRIPSGKVRGGPQWFEPDGSQRDRHSPRGVKDDKLRPNIWNYVIGQNKCGHPATFPYQLAEDHVLSWSNPGDLVMDPFCGSGTTGMAALKNGRRFVGIESNQEYVELSRRRCEL